MKTITLDNGKEIELNQAFNVDCLEFMKMLPDKCIDLVLTDPPYGIGQGGGKNRTRVGLAKPQDYKDYNDKHPLTKEHFREMFRISKNQIIFGANHFISLIPFDSSSWLVWDKQNEGTDYADCELAYTSHKSAVRKYTFRWNGMLQGNMKNKEQRIHPNQKPVNLFSMILKDYSKENDIIFDACLGSFAVPIACHKNNNYWLGCELDPDYFKSGYHRYEQETKQMLMEF
jgi:site-specific DNA-methyltransferase (adenine-specific)